MGTREIRLGGKVGRALKETTEKWGAYRDQVKNLAQRNLQVIYKDGPN